MKEGNSLRRRWSFVDDTRQNNGRSLDQVNLILGTRGPWNGTLGSQNFGLRGYHGQLEAESVNARRGGNLEKEKNKKIVLIIYNQWQLEAFQVMPDMVLVIINLLFVAHYKQVISRW